MSKNNIQLVLEEADTGDWKQAYTPSKRVSYHRSLTRLATLGLIESKYEEIDDYPDRAKGWWQFVPKTKRFRFYLLTEKGIKEAEKIESQLCKDIEDYQNLLTNVVMNFGRL